MGTIFENITIVGVGLIGGSLGMAIKEKKLAKFVVGVTRREETIKLAQQKKAIDYGTLNLKEGIKDSDLIIVATPVGMLVEKIKEIFPLAKKGAIISDVGSVKDLIVKRIENFIPEGVDFLGGHPLAGLETSGIESAKTSLFEGTIYVLTPTEKTSPKTLDPLISLIEGIGAKVLIISPEEHDTLIAGVSHLPHLIASTLVNTVYDFHQKDMVLKLAAGGFKDTTRIASSSPQLWEEICLANRWKIMALIQNFKKNLSKLEEIIQEGDREKLRNFFNKAKELREKINKKD